MTDHHAMDADVPSLGGLSGSSSSSWILDLLGDDLAALNVEMKHYSEICVWSRFEKASDELWLWLCSQALIYLLSELANTKLKSDIIAVPSHKRSVEIVRGFNDTEVEQWNVGMRNGVENNDWSSLITHPKLRTPVWTKVAPGVPMELKHAVVNAWSMKYHGDTHKYLLRVIDDLHVLPVEHSYAKIMPIAQSSGMGKSRTVDMVAMERILFPVCLREELGRNSFAYPLADEPVREYFDGAPSPADTVRCKRYIRLFLSSLFASAHLQVQRLFPTGTKTYMHMARVFYDYFAIPSQRKMFYEGVVKNAHRSCSQNVQQCFQELEEGLKRRCSNWPSTSVCPILISFDEAHLLYTDRRSDYTLYSLMTSVLNEVITCAFVIVTISTQIPTLVLSEENTLSIRERDNERLLPAAFTELPFDVHQIAEPLTPNKATLATVGSLEFTAKFGRPLLYSSYLSRKGLQTDTEGVQMMRIIREKLSGRTWPPSEVPAELDVSSIAILSARLLLYFSPAAVDARPLEEELVRNHLRILYSVDKIRETIVTGSSPEPLIAEASAQIMNFEMNGRRYINLWDLLVKFVNDGLARQGAVGELIGHLIGRALSISAMDYAINRLPTVCKLKYQTPVTVADYYKALLTDEAWQALRESIPANYARLSKISAKKNFEDAFEDAYFHFSHYAMANDATPVRDGYAWALWLRGTAAVCENKEEPMDRMAPIYFSSRGKVSPKTVSVNIDQDKTGLLFCKVGMPSAEDLSIFSDGHKLPYITVVHYYALTGDKDITVTNPSAHNRRKGRACDMEAPRYEIELRGLSAYRNMTDPVRKAVQGMISNAENALFVHHTRKYGVSALRRMLPVLTRDQVAKEWLRGT